MDNFLREELERAFALDDEVKRDHERWQRDYERRRQQQPVKQRSAPDELVYKTHWPTEQELVRPQPQQTAQMDQRTADEWNRWLSDYVERAIKQYDKQLSESLLDAIGEAFSIERADMRKHISEQVRQLREELGALRADLTIDRAIKRGEVSQLHGEVPKKRRNDVA